jgi:hypothetical protein
MEASSDNDRYGGFDRYLCICQKLRYCTVDTHQCACIAKFQYLI